VPPAISRFSCSHNLPSAVDAEVLPVHPGDLDLQHLIALLARSRLSTQVLVVRRRSDPHAVLTEVLGQHGADRLDTPAQTAVSHALTAVGVLADELHDQ